MEAWEVEMIVIRTIKNGRVKINHKIYACRVPCDLTSRLAFGTYYRTTHGDFINLWGSEESFKSKTDQEHNINWTKDFEKLGAKINGDGLTVGSGNYKMDKQHEKWIAYRSKGYDWWDVYDP